MLFQDAPKEKTHLRNIFTNKILSHKSDDLPTDKTLSHDTHKIHPQNSEEKIEVEDTFLSHKLARHKLHIFNI